jgi:hypothetical protein
MAWLRRRLIKEIEESKDAKSYDHGFVSSELEITRNSSSDPGSIYEKQ